MVLFAVGSLLGCFILLPFVFLDNLSVLTWKALWPLVLNGLYATGAAVGGFKTLAIVGPINNGVLAILCRVFIVMWSCAVYGTVLNTVQTVGLAATLLGAAMFWSATSAAAAAAVSGGSSAPTSAATAAVQLQLQLQSFQVRVCQCWCLLSTRHPSEARAVCC